VAFLQVQGAPYITRQLALRWATQPAKAQPAIWAERLGIIRRFAIWRSATEPRTEIPPAGLPPHRYRRKPPHIYSDEEIEKVLRGSQQLPSPNGLRARTYTTLFGLLVTTGKRVNEALGLDRVDIDLERGILHIRRTKFGKSICARSCFHCGGSEEIHRIPRSRFPRTTYTGILHFREG
jgi:integrase/recombinase XerD